MSREEAKQKTDRIIQMLLGRKGFEYWWNPNAGGMEHETQAEIRDEITKIIES